MKYQKGLKLCCLHVINIINNDNSCNRSFACVFVLFSLPIFFLQYLHYTDTGGNYHNQYNILLRFRHTDIYPYLGIIIIEDIMNNFYDIL